MFDTKLGVIVLKRTVKPKQKIQLLIYMLGSCGTVRSSGGVWSTDQLLTHMTHSTNGSSYK